MQDCNSHPGFLNFTECEKSRILILNQDFNESFAFSIETSLISLNYTLIDPRRIVDVNGRLFTINDKEIVNQVFYFVRGQFLRPLNHLKEEPNVNIIIILLVIQCKP